MLAADIDHFAAAAIAANAALNGVDIEITTADVVGAADPRWQVITAGDVCYEQPMAGRVTAWLRSLARGGADLVMLGDPGRAYLPADGLSERTRYVVPTSRELEDRDSREGVVWSSGGLTSRERDMRGDVGRSSPCDHGRSVQMRALLASAPACALLAAVPA